MNKRAYSVAIGLFLCFHGVIRAEDKEAAHEFLQQPSKKKKKKSTRDTKEALVRELEAIVHESTALIAQLTVVLDQALYRVRELLTQDKEGVFSTLSAQALEDTLVEISDITSMLDRCYADIEKAKKCVSRERVCKKIT